MRHATKIFVLLAVAAVSLFAINSGNTASAQALPAGTDIVIISVTTDFASSPTASSLVVLTGTMTVEREAESGGVIECEIVAMQLSGTFGGIPLTVLAGSQNGITPSICHIEEILIESFALSEFSAYVFLEVDVGNDGSVDAKNCGGTAIDFGATLSAVPITSSVSFGPTAAATGVGVALCDPKGTTPIGSFGASAFNGGADPVPPPGPPAVGGILGISAEDGSPAGSESSSSTSAMTLILLGVGLVTIVALASSGWYVRRRLIP